MGLVREVRAYLINPRGRRRGRFNMALNSPRYCICITQFHFAGCGDPNRLQARQEICECIAVDKDGQASLFEEGVQGEAAMPRSRQPLAARMRAQSGQLK